MKTERISKTTTISLPPKLYKEVQRLARKNGMTKSELFRVALRRYQREEREWEELFAYGRRKARETGIKPEDIEDIVDEIRSGGD